jgi:hypothetical protein
MQAQHLILAKLTSMKIVLPAILLLLLASCAFQRPITVERSQNNDTYTVEYLFEHDGCKVYRFMDRGDYIYFTNCNGQAIATTDSTRTYNRTSIKKQ